MKKLFITVLTIMLLANVMVAQENKYFTVGGVFFEMVYVEGGTFTMGCTNGDGDCVDSEFPTHQVTLSDYYIGKYEVFQKLWNTLMGENRCYFQGDYYCVESVSWNECQEFIAKLNEATGENFCLPTEAQWEYAAKGGNKSQGYIFSGSNDVNAVAWSNATKVYNVGSKAPNELGLYDMSGNVWEWCNDFYCDYSRDKVTDPTGPREGSERVMRGGSRENGARMCRVSRRGARGPNERSWDCGFRLALVPKTESSMEQEEQIELEEAPQGVINGKFSVGDGQQVYFSQGNLQYQATTKTWRFAENQYSFIGEANVNISPDYSGWTDLFGWGTGKYPSAISETYCGNIKAVDWGTNVISNTDVVNWYTPISGEWRYLFNDRNTASGIRFAKAYVNRCPGMLLLPDDWDASVYALNSANDAQASYSSNNIAADDWVNKLEANGAVFLPAAGSMDPYAGGFGNKGGYWSFSRGDLQHAYVSFTDYNFFADAGNYGAYGFSVRLVCPVKGIKLKDPDAVVEEQQKVTVYKNYSVSDDKVVWFSKGNLQYQTSTATWRFADKQWYCVGIADTRKAAECIWMDLFGWGTGSNPDLQSRNNGDYASFNDWGSAKISNGENKEWFTLTKDEWNYLLNVRNTNSGIRYAKAKVNCVFGVILLPDDWDPSVYGLDKTNNPSSFYENHVSADDWEEFFEPNGAIFLPAADYREGYDVRNATGAGGYWSSTESGDTGAFCLFFAQRDVLTDQVSERNRGYSVRLVCNAE